MPLLADATKPKYYLNKVEKVDLVYCDVAQEKQSELSQELAALNEQRASLSREIRLLKTDPDYVEKVIRQRLNYVRKNEILYLFDKNRQEGSWTENKAEAKP